MDRNLVSILLPVYNGERFLQLAIQSVLSQTYTNFELLIYNDGSTDSSLQIIKSFNDYRIKYFSFNGNKGIVHGLNFLLKKAEGEFIARIDADDIWYKDKLKKQLAATNEKNENVFIACFARLIDDKGGPFPTKFKQYSDFNDIKKYLPNSNFIIHSSVLISKDLFEKTGGYRDKYLYAEDYDLWLRMLKKRVNIVNLKEVLLDYRISAYSINFRFKKAQSKNVIRLKFNYWQNNGFEFFYLLELIRDFYYWFFPYWILRLNWVLRLKLKYSINSDKKL